MHVGKVWVTGEISNFSTPASGHWYFTLKDSQSQIRCAMFKGRNRFLRTQPANGMEILLNGNVSLYEARGDYQMIVDYLEESGVGAIQRQFEQLKTKLSAKGLFDSQHKQSLPKMAKHIAVITSRSGAAIHDIINVISTRQPSMKMTLIPATVQGEAAANTLIAALKQTEQLHQQDPVDAVIIGRGGGSAEDLWPFNNEQLAETIFNFSLPIISAVGHEVDFSICDYVCDVRAATPSQAAELISIDQKQLMMRFDDLEAQFKRTMASQLQQKQKELHLVQQALRHPGEKLQNFRQQFDAIEKQLSTSIKYLIERNQEKLHHIERRLSPTKLEQQLEPFKQELANMHRKLQKSILDTMMQKKQLLANNSTKLDLVSPLATLERGFSITENNEGQVLHQSSHVSPGDKVITTLAKGKLHCEIIETID